MKTNIRRLDDSEMKVVVGGGDLTLDNPALGLITIDIKATEEEPFVPSDWFFVGTFVDSAGVVINRYGTLGTEG